VLHGANGATIPFETSRTAPPPATQVGPPHPAGPPPVRPPAAYAPDWAPAATEPPRADPKQAQRYEPGTAHRPSPDAGGPPGLPDTKAASIAAADAAAGGAPASLGRRLLRVVSALLSLAVIGGIGAFAAIERETVARFLPGAAPLYAAVGYPVNVRGLDFRKVESVWVDEDGRLELEVRGEVHNISSSERPIGAIAVDLQDKTGRTITRWFAYPRSQRVSRGGFTKFAVRVTPPAEAPAGLKVHFAK
jgi:hypothetical protein